MGILLGRIRDKGCSGLVAHRERDSVVMVMNGAPAGYGLRDEITKASFQSKYTFKQIV